MKIRFVLLLTLVLTTGLMVQAQPGGRRTVEERVKTIHDKIDSAFKLEPAKLAKVDTAFAVYYRKQDKLREELMSGGERPDFQVMREKMQPMTDERDKELKTILTGDQFKTWKDQIEPSLRPRRQQGGGGN